MMLTIQQSLAGISIAIVAAVLIFCSWLTIVLYLYLLLGNGFRIGDNTAFFGSPTYVTQPVPVGLIAGSIIGAVYGLLLGVAIHSQVPVSPFRGMIIGFLVGEALILAFFLVWGLLSESNPIFLVISWFPEQFVTFLELSAILGVPSVLTGLMVPGILRFFGLDQ